MTVKSLFSTGLILLLHYSLRAQDSLHYRVLRFSSSHTSFPDSGRVNGHVGSGVLYPRAGHYDDSSVLVVLPRGWVPGKETDLVFWFHGWHNNIDTALRFYALARQFAAARRNAVLVLAETAKDAADSYGGKMQQKGMFRQLVTDVLGELERSGVAAGAAGPVSARHILLAGHSGAYQVIADILQNGQMPVDEVFLFDALYARVDTYLDWIAASGGHHFVHWYTNHGGGTDEMSDTLMHRLAARRIGYGTAEESMLGSAPGARILRSERVLFVHSPREHNVIINDPDDLQLLLENSSWLVPGGMEKIPEDSIVYGEPQAFQPGGIREERAVVRGRAGTPAASSGVFYSGAVKCSADLFAGHDRAEAKTHEVGGTPKVFATFDDFYTSGLVVADAQMLHHQPAITKDPASPRVKEEKIGVTIRQAYIYGIYKEDDNDFHMIIGNGKQGAGMNLFNAEVSGLPGDVHDQLLIAARDTVIKRFGEIACGSGAYKPVGTPIPISISGSIFFDVDHKAGIVGFGVYKPKTAWEIHPVTAIRFLDE